MQTRPYVLRGMARVTHTPANTGISDLELRAFIACTYGRGTMVDMAFLHTAQRFTLQERLDTYDLHGDGVMDGKW